MRHSRRVSGLTHLSLNSIDVLAGLPTVKICVAYELDGKEITHYPASLKELERCKPIYEEMQDGLKILLECVLWKNFQKQHATMFFVLQNSLVSVSQHSLLVQTVTKQTFWKTFGKPKEINLRASNH